MLRGSSRRASRGWMPSRSPRWATLPGRPAPSPVPHRHRYDLVGVAGSQGHRSRFLRRLPRRRSRSCVPRRRGRGLCGVRHRCFGIGPDVRHRLRFSRSAVLGARSPGVDARGGTASATGGFVYVLDGHPLAQVFDFDDPGVKELRIQPEQQYFRDQPHRHEREGTYADPRATMSNPVTYEWNHPIGEIIQATRDAGLAVEFLHEFPVDVWQRFPFMLHDGQWWRIAGDPIPLMFSIRARKES